MQYLLLLHSDERRWAEMAPEVQTEWIGAYQVFLDSLTDAGVFVASNRLAPSSKGALVKVVAGKRKVMDGPFAETKEQLGGYFMIDVSDLETAVEWAGRCPGAQHGSVEVREIGVGALRCSGSVE